MATLASGKLSEMFEDFLKSVQDRSGGYVYRTKISQLISSEGKSLVVDFGDLLKYNSDLANRILLEPDSSLASFKIAAFETMRSENALYADRVKRELTVRIRAIPDLIPLRKVDTSYLDRMLAIAGMVVRTSELRPLMTSAAWVCPSGHLTYQDQDDMALKRPPKCELCGEARNFELDRKKSRFIDFQILRVQELPEELPPGQLPQFFDVNVEGDMVNMARPGDRAVLTGVVRAVPDYALGQVRTRLFRSQIDCNHVEVKGKEPEQVQVTKEDEALIKDIAGSSDAYEKLISSIAPVILGHLPEKEAILLLLAGGNSTPLPDGTKLRGDINVLFVGDPGVAKSEMLKFAAQVAPRGIFASGRGTTSAGLSAAVIREKNVLMLEAGVVVLADQGIACITEDTDVYTGQGLERIGDIWESIPGPTYLTKTGREAKKTLLPVNIYDRKMKTDLSGSAYSIMRRRHTGEVIKLTFSSGLCLKVTPEHLLKRVTDVKNLWIRADELKPGDELRAPVRVFGPPAALNVTPEQAYAVGCVYGDGWLGPSSITISQSKVNGDVVHEIVRRMPSTFAVYDRGDRVRQLGRYKLISRMMQLYTTDQEFLRVTQLLLRSPSTDRVLMLTDDSLWAFLGGVFDTDGDLNHFGGRVVAARIYPTKSEHELAVLLYVLRRLGIYARVHGKKSSIPVVQITGGDISKFLWGIAPYSVKLRREPEEVVIKHKGRRSLERGHEKVVAVERVQYDGYVYDLSVGKYHNYESGLVYVHNCIDEFDKMKPEDRTALHESMEQQSYHPSTELMFSDGSKVRIGEYVEGAFESNPKAMVQGKDCEILPMRGGPGILSVGSGNQIFEATVDRVSRHIAPDHFVRLKYSNGRSILVTPEHPVYVFRRGEITTIPASEVAVGDFVPAPRMVPPSNARFPLESVAAAGNAKQILQQAEMSPSLARVLGYLVTEGCFFKGRTTEVDFANYEGWILEDMKVYAQRLFGFAPIYGHVSGRTTSLRFVSKVLYDYFAHNFPEMVNYARKKRVPRQILSGDYESVRQFASSAFLGDGGVESTAVCYKTSSIGLAEDYQDLLLRLGISSRMVRDRSNDSYKVYITGDSLQRFLRTVCDPRDSRIAKLRGMVRRGRGNIRHHDALPTDVARTLAEARHDLGLRYDGRYFNNMSRGYGIARDSVEAELVTLERRVDDLLDVVGNPELSLREMRVRCGWSQADIALIAGITRGNVDYFERGGYRSDGKNAIEFRVRSAVLDHLGATKIRLAKVRGLLDLRFLRVRCAEKVGNEGELRTNWVYDVTVEPTHNFIAGGLVLHNTITIAKGGIYAALNARTAILAACNPVLGRYNPFQNLTENISTLPIPLLTRFDLIFVIKDQPQPAEDERLATHILQVHERKTYSTPPPVEFSLLKKYIAYAKKTSPTLTKDAMARLKDYYLELRKGGGEEGQIPPTPRTLESLVRVSTARARILLRDQVSEEDALAAIALMNRMVEDVLTDATTKKTDFGIQLGKPVGETKNLRAALEIFKGLEGTEKKPVERKAFKEELVKARFSDEDAEKMIRTMFREGLVYESKPGFIRRLGA